MLPGESNETKNSARCNERLTAISGDDKVRFIALLSHFGCKQVPSVEGKSDKSPEISHLKPAAWVLPDESNVTKNYARCNEKLTAMSDEINARFTALLSPFGRTQRPVCEGKVGQVT